MIKLVNKEEINQVMEIINDAKELLKKDSLQWQQGYPNENTMLNDINSNNLYGYYIDDYLVGVVSLIIGLDINYTEIYQGEWVYPASENDLTIHRIAVRKNYHKKKIGDSLMKHAIKVAKENNIKTIKIDTHIKNIPMQTLSLNNGFIYRGVILLKRDEVDNSRLAYELCL